METSILLAVQIGRLFIMILMGFVLVKAKVCRSEDSKGVAAINLYLCTPCLILCTFQLERSPDNVNSVIASLAVAMLIQGVLFLFGAVFRRLFRLKLQDYLPLPYLNCGNILVPIIASMLGTQYVIYTIGMLVMQTVFLWSHCLSLISGEKRINLRKIFLNVNMIAVGAGVIMFLTGWRLPPFLDGIVVSISDMVGPLAMLNIGMVLAGMKDLGGNVKSILRTAGMRLLVMPAVVLPFMYIASRVMKLPDKASILMVAFLASACPSSSTLVQLSVRYNNEPEYAGGISAVTSLLCIVTMPVMIYLFQLVVK